MREVVQRMRCARVARCKCRRMRGAGNRRCPFPLMFALLKEHGYDVVSSIEKASNTGVEGALRQGSCRACVVGVTPQGNPIGKNRGNNA